MLGKNSTLQAMQPTQLHTDSCRHPAWMNSWPGCLGEKEEEKGRKRQQDREKKGREKIDRHKKREMGKWDRKERQTEVTKSNRQGPTHPEAPERGLCVGKVG